jgi:hypothetical protein
MFVTHPLAGVNMANNVCETGTTVAFGLDIIKIG